MNPRPMLTLYAKVLVAGAGICVVTAPIIPGLPNRVRVKSRDGTLYELDADQCHAPQRPRLVVRNGELVQP